MKGRTLLALTLIAALASAAPVEAPDGPREQLAELVQHVEQGEYETAAEALEQLLEREQELAEIDRARLQYARGLLTLLAEQERPTTVEAPTAARDAFLSARALAGPGELRLAATYDAGVAVLESAERARAHLPELREQEGTTPGAAGAAAPPPFASQLAAQSQPGGPARAAGSATEGESEAPDALAFARSAYEEARDLLLERLRADWRDVDTRANLEWIERRLAELDRIQEQREKDKQQDQDSDKQDQKQDSQKPQDSQKSDDSKDSNGEGNEQGDSSQDEAPKEPQDGDPSDPSQRDGSEEDPQSQQGQDDSSQANPDEQQAGNPDDSKEAQSPESKGEPDPSQLDEDEAPEPKSGRPPKAGGEAHGGRPLEDESHLTHEEVTRLLDRLGEIEQRGEELQRALRRVRRVPVDRDW